MSLFRDQVNEHGIRPFARTYGFAHSTIRQMYQGKRPLGPRVAQAIGLERVTAWVKKTA